ncbi:MAG: long-chain fatty acid--CoA ligase [Spirochaetes bacterium]|nr:long-chain fatty acid--CoA ligase [Spirochaetota bacterium]
MEKEYNSIGEMFQDQVKKLQDKACVAAKMGGKYVDISWKEMDALIRKLAGYLMAEGIKKGDRVALFSPNRYEWWVADQAILSIGAVNVPIYATNSAEEARYVIDHSGSKICIVATEDHLSWVLAVKKKLKALKRILIFDDISKKPAGVITLKEAYKKGEAYNAKHKGEFERRLKAVKLKDMATIIYTSGTTGNPKGVMLSHDNFLSNLYQIKADFGNMFEDDFTFLSFLPLSHSLERTAGYYMPVAAGLKVAFAEDFSTIQQNLQEIRPHVLISVPRLYEKIHAGILSRVADIKGIKKLIFKWGMSVARRNLPYVCQNKKPRGILALEYKIIDKLFYSKLKAALGLDRLRFAVSGGGPLSVSDAEFFLGMGIVVLEGFGLTETTPVTNVNRPGEIKPGSVGRPLVETDIKISDEGEILIKGPQVMMGYYKNRKATREAFTKDGYFRTGDIGTIDEQGRLYITGRIKDIIVTAGGKNISPQNIENSVKASKYIEQIAVIGDRRKYLSALVIPNFAEVEKWAKKQGIQFSSRQELINDSRVNDLIAKEIEKYTKNFARVEQIRKFKLLDAEWTQATGELTPTLKVKRRVIEQKYAAEIESMYPPEKGE